MLIWSGVENGFLVDEFYDEGRRLLAEARDAFPGNPVLPQYFSDAWTPPGHAEGQQGGRGEWDWVQPQQARRRIGKGIII